MTRRQLKKLQSEKLNSLKDPVALMNSLVDSLERSLEQNQARDRAEGLLIKWAKK